MNETELRADMFAKTRQMIESARELFTFLLPHVTPFAQRGLAIADRFEENLASHEHDTVPELRRWATTEMLTLRDQLTSAVNKAHEKVMEFEEMQGL